MKTLLVLLCFGMSHLTYAQDLPYREIPAYPETYTAYNAKASVFTGKLRD